MLRPHTDSMSGGDPTIVYPFRKRDPLTGKWYRARYKASTEEIAEHQGKWIIDGPPEVYRTLGSTSAFRPWQRPQEPEQLLVHPQREAPPVIDPLERFLALMFLRRHITYCVRRRRFAQGQGAALLYRELVQG